MENCLFFHIFISLIRLNISWYRHPKSIHQLTRKSKSPLPNGFLFNSRNVDTHALKIDLSKTQNDDLQYVIYNGFTKRLSSSIVIGLLCKKKNKKTNKWGKKIAASSLIATPIHLESTHVCKQYLLYSTSLVLDNILYANAICALHANLRRRIGAEVFYCNNEILSWRDLNCVGKYQTGD